MRRIHISINLIFLLLAQASYSQVTIGSGKPPEKFSILELDGIGGGLRLNNLTTLQRDALPVDNKVSSRGLVIYNADSLAIEVYDGLKWIKLSQATANIPNLPEMQLVSNVDNGLTLNGTTAELGGTLNKNTTINTNAKSLYITGTTINAFSVGGGTLSVNAANSRVGIGTSSPAAKLDISGNLRVATVAALGTNTSTMVAREGTTGILGTIPITVSGGTGSAGKTTIGNNVVLSTLTEKASLFPLGVDASNHVYKMGVTASTRPFTYVSLNLNTVNGDYLANFDTKISSIKYTVILAGYQFSNEITLLPSGNIAPLNARAFISGGTWRINLDYNGSGTPSGVRGNWIVNILIIDNTMVNSIGTKTFDLGGMSSGSAPSAIVP